MADREPARAEPARVVVVSHPAVLAVNQDVYVELLDLGWDVRLVVPRRWKHEYAAEPFEAELHPGLEGRVRPEPVAPVGSVQRHLYLRPPTSILRDLEPQVVFLEEEYYSLPAAQWGAAASRLGVPFGVQADENLDRELPTPARVARSFTLGRTSFVAARSPTAARLARLHGGPARSGIVPHAVPRWNVAPPRQDDVFTVGFAGRLVEQKGVRDLVAACELLDGPVRLLVAGDGPLRGVFRRAELPAPGLDLRSDLGHTGMPVAYAEMDVLVLPSRTTPRWAEQYGRVLAEALSFGVPVIGSDSGEIPWVIGETGGGEVFPEGDVVALAAALRDVRARPDVWRERGRHGRDVVAACFSVPAAAASLGRLLQRALDR